MVKTSEKLNEMQNQLGAMQETLKRIETHYLKQLQEVSGSRGSVPEVRREDPGGEFAKLLKQSPFAERTVLFQAEEK